MSCYVNRCTFLDGEKARRRLAETPVATFRHSSSLRDSIFMDMSWSGRNGGREGRRDKEEKRECWNRKYKENEKDQAFI